MDGLASGKDGRVELWRYEPFGLIAWLEPGTPPPFSGPQLLESGGQSWMQSRTPVLLPQSGRHTLVVRQNVTSSIARQRTLLLPPPPTTAAATAAAAAAKRQSLLTRSSGANME